MEAALGNIPTIAFCDTDSPMRYVDIGIPANNKGKHKIGCLNWLLARLVLQMRGTLRPAQKWDVMVDPFFYREPEEANTVEEDEAAAITDYGMGDYSASAIVPSDNWASAIPDAQWSGDASAALPVVPAAPAAGVPDWSAAPVADGDLLVCLYLLGVFLSFCYFLYTSSNNRDPSYYCE